MIPPGLALWLTIFCCLNPGSLLNIDCGLLTDSWIGITLVQSDRSAPRRTARASRRPGSSRSARVSRSSPPVVAFRPLVFLPYEMGFRRKAILWSAVLNILVSLTESSPYPPAISSLLTFTLEDLVPLNPEFYPDRIAVQWISGTEYVFMEPGEGIKKYNALTDTYETFLEDSVLANLSQYHLTSFSKDGKRLLLSAHKKKVYRYSSIADYWVYDIDTQHLYKIGRQPLQVVAWGTNRSLAYVYANNVYYVPDVGQPDAVAQLTYEGVPGEIYFGAADWIYEEEVFNAAEALWFSPDGSYLAVVAFNDTKVESAIFPYYGNPVLSNPYPELVHFKYPKAGQTNPAVGLYVFNLKSLASPPKLIPAPVDLIGIDHIIGKVSWASRDNLVVLWLNRRQNVSILVNCDLKNDKCDLVKERVEPNGWIDIPDAFFDSTGTRMLDIQPMYHNDQRYFHVARFNFNTSTLDDLSPGNSTAVKILGYNEDSDAVYYLVSPSETPWQRQVWATIRDQVVCITCGQTYCGTVSSSFAPGASYAVLECSTSNVPSKTYLYDAKKHSFKLLKDNVILQEKLNTYRLPTPTYSVIPLRGEHVAHVRLLLPPDLDIHEKYPMIVKVYAGPGSTRVRDMFELEYSTYLAGNRSFIVCYVDVRGSGVMGVDALHSVNNALGTVEVTDTLEAIRQLTKLHSFIDPKRIGVWGWSYGGFTTLTMMVKDERRELACGAAVAPVTSWVYYDSIYTERYMSVPAVNRAAYLKSDLSASAEKLRGRKLLLIHGSADDNVHFQNSMLLAKKLQHADIPFEQMNYADENHSLLRVSRHLYHTLDRFWTECFA